MDLTPLATARLAYVDCYRIIDAAACAAITASRAPLLLNLGSDPLSDTIAAAHGRHIAFTQTNLDEANADQAETLATQLHEHLNADTIVITLGRLGALARTANDTIIVSAPDLTVRHTHGAGVAFSGGLAHAHLNGANTTQAIRAGCQAGIAHCAATRHVPRQRLHHDRIKEPQP